MPEHAIYLHSAAANKGTGDKPHHQHLSGGETFLWTAAQSVREIIGCIYSAHHLGKSVRGIKKRGWYYSIKQRVDQWVKHKGTWHFEESQLVKCHRFQPQTHSSAFTVVITADRGLNKLANMHRSPYPHTCTFSFSNSRPAICLTIHWHCFFFCTLAGLRWEFRGCSRWIWKWKASQSRWAAAGWPGRWSTHPVVPPHKRPRRRSDWRRRT